MHRAQVSEELKYPFSQIKQIEEVLQTKQFGGHDEP